MKTAKDVLEYLRFEGLNLHNLIGEDDSEFNQGRLYVMNKIINSVNQLINIESVETAKHSNKCSHSRVDRWNHGYHSECLDCGATDI